MRLLLIVALAACPVIAQPAADEVLATVVYVIDGDTIVAETAGQQRKNVRIVAIDAPEKGRRDVRGQPYSERSRQHLELLVTKRDVRLVVHGVDDYGRTLARVWLGDTDIGLAQVCAGYGWLFEAFSYELSPAEQQSYRACQAQARQQRRGLWQGSHPVPPWQWRRAHRDAGR